MSEDNMVQTIVKNSVSAKKVLEPSVSILIPVYNAEKYLEQCLDSCINQTYKNIEIVCVNDGSTDSSAEILNKYAQKDSRVKVYSQKNGGIAKAYETAVKNANGEWIYLLDNDDWLNLQAIEFLVKKAAKDIKIDYIYCKYQTWYIEKKGEFLRFKHPVFKYKTKGLRKFKNYVSPYKFFKKSLYKGVVFPEHLCEYQDSCLSWQIISNAKHPVVTDLNIYYYRVREDSVSHKPKKWDYCYESYFKAWNAVKEFLINTGKWEKEKWQVYYWKITQYKHFYKNSCKDLPAEVVFNDYKKFLNDVNDDIKFLFNHTEEYDLVKHLDFETYKKYMAIPSYNIIQRKLFVRRNLKNKL